MNETQSSSDILTKLQGIATLAKGAPNLRFTSLAHLLNRQLLEYAFQRTRKSGAPGIDGETGAEYGQKLHGRLDDLVTRLKAGQYRAPPVKRAYIPKPGGKTRPLGLPTFEDKILQRAVAMILEAIYEQDFLDCSHGFRPKRSAQHALDRLWWDTTMTGGGWIIELDIQNYFEEICHRQLLEMVDQRIGDGVLKRLLGKWLNAGVLEAGEVHRRNTGTPQGGVISPILANIYLHEILDTWFQDVVLPRMRGEASLIRYADDGVMVFTRKDDAERVMAVLAKRFAKFGLTLHPEKTRLLDFRKPHPRGKRRRGCSFDFLGFTHFWAKSRKGKWVVRPKTSKSRMRRTITALTQWCRANRHLSLEEQHRQLSMRLKGHYSYFGRIGNGRALSQIWWHTNMIWWKWLSRRSQNGRMTWAKYERKVLKKFKLPSPRMTRSNLANAKP